MNRVRHAWLVITGRVTFNYSTERMEFEMVLENLTALVAQANDAADRLINKAASDAGALAQAQGEIADLEAQAVAAVQPLADKLNAAAPQPQ